MSYKTELQGNNADLQNILNEVNALPDAQPATSITATTDGAGNVIITLSGATATYSDGNVTIE